MPIDEINHRKAVWLIIQAAIIRKIFLQLLIISAFFRLPDCPFCPLPVCFADCLRGGSSYTEWESA